MKKYYVSKKRLENLKKEVEKIEKLKMQIEKAQQKIENIKEKNSDLRYLGSESTKELSDDEQIELHQLHKKILYA